MTTRKIKAPSGLTGVVRGLKGKEANVLADKAQARRLTTFDTILDACWQSTDDVPPVLQDTYIGKEGTPDWSKVLLGDRMFILVQIRIATYGSEYAFKHKCSGCDHGFEWGINLDELKLETFSEDSLTKYVNGNRFDAVLPDGKKFWFTLSNGGSEKIAAKRIKKKRDELVTISLSERIVEIEGVGSNKKEVRVYLEEMELDDQYEIIDIMDEADAGYQTDLEVECEECGNEDLVRIPFVGDFWISQRRRRARAAAAD